MTSSTHAPRTGPPAGADERVRETDMTRIYVGVILVQVVTILALLWLEFTYTR